MTDALRTIHKSATERRSHVPQTQGDSRPVISLVSRRFMASRYQPPPRQARVCMWHMSIHAYTWDQRIPKTPIDVLRARKEPDDESNASDARERAHDSIGEYVRWACAPLPAPGQRMGRARGARARNAARTRREAGRRPAFTAGRRLRRVVRSVLGEWSDLRWRPRRGRAPD